MAVALVTGTSSGLGLATAVSLARAGQHRHVDDAKSRRSRGPPADHREREAADHINPLDVDDDDSVRDAFAKVVAEHGSIDMLVNNAGIPVRPRRIAASSRSVAARLLLRCRPAHLRRPRGHRNARQGARRSAAAAGPACSQDLASELSAAPLNPLRIAARSVSGALGRAEAGCRDHLSDLDGRRPLAAHGLRWPPGGQAGPAGRISTSEVLAPGLRSARKSRRAKRKRTSLKSASDVRESTSSRHRPTVMAVLTDWAKVDPRCAR